MSDIDTKLQDHDKRIRDVEQTQVVMHADIKHIRTRLDNGVSTTVTKIWDKINEMAPKVKENSYWVDKWKMAIFWIAIIGVIGSGLGVTFAVLQHKAIKSAQQPVTGIHD